MSYGLSANALDQGLVFKFFCQFSVFECALKHEGFVKEGPHRSAQPDWSAFERHICGCFDGVDQQGMHQALELLSSRPPKCQVVLNGRLRWEDIDRKPDLYDESYYLLLVRTVRNNLFHGGKWYPDGPIEQFERDAALLESALVVLDACYELHPGIARWRTAA